MTASLILITGSSDGIGKATAAELMNRGAEVIVHSRTGKVVQAARRNLAKITGCDMPEGVCSDFTDMAAVRQIAEEISARSSWPAFGNPGQDFSGWCSSAVRLSVCFAEVGSIASASYVRVPLPAGIPGVHGPATLLLSALYSKSDMLVSARD